MMNTKTTRTDLSRTGGRVSPLPMSRRNELAAFLRNTLETLKDGGAKHARMQNAIRQAIVSGTLQPGDQLPPEQELADGVGLSLGTVRRCLSQLAKEGIVSREHGRGTFVAGFSMTENEVWHLRFLEDDLQTVRPIYQRVIARNLVTKSGSWSDVLGDSAAGYIRVERAVNVDSRLLCYSDFYLSAERFSDILDMSEQEIGSVGMKHILALRFHAPIMRVQKILQTAPVPRRAATVIRSDPGTPTQRLQIIGYGSDNLPVSYQVIWIPHSDLPLELSAMPSRSER